MLTLALNIPHFRKLLGEKKEDLTSNIKRLEGEGLTGGERDVRDSTEASLASRTLLEVQDALLRIAHNAYGTCIACGEQIETGRLEAAPWSAYCLEDQQKLDQAIRQNN